MGGRESGSGTCAAQMALYIMRQTLFVLYHVHVIELIFPGPTEVQAEQ